MTSTNEALDSVLEDEIAFLLETNPQEHEATTNILGQR